MANYVKFMRGTPRAYEALLKSPQKPNADTLYFIYEEDAADAVLYLGEKLIAGGAADISAATLRDLSDVDLSLDLQNKVILVYDKIAGKWVDSSLEEALSVFVGTNGSASGQAGLVPAPKAEEKDYFLRSDGTWAPIETSNKANVWTVENEDASAMHQDIIEDVTADILLSPGDIIIIKDNIAEDKWQHTSYVYTGSAWAAMDGNYDAENVYFSEDILVTTKVGTIQTLKNGQATLAAKGKNVKQVLSSLLAERKTPTATLPSASITITNAGSYEVGTTLTPAWKTTFSTGSYTYGPATGVTDKGGSVTSTKDTTAESISAGSIHNKTGSFDSYQVEDNVTYKAKLVYGWNAGTSTPVDNFGDSYTSSANNLPIKEASNKEVSSSNSITGFRKWFKGGLPTSSAVALTSNIIRGLNGSSSAVSAQTFDLLAADYTNCKRVVIAIPASSNISVKEVLLKSASNADITSEFKKKDAINVEGAEGYTAVSYNIWVYEPASLDSTEVYTITLG